MEKKLNRAELEEELRLQFIERENSFARHLYIYKRQFDHWAHNNLSQEGYPQIKIGYLPFLMNIGNDGVTNTELAKLVKVTKQAMSKTLKELLLLDMIEQRPNPNDARSSLIFLSDKGLEMVISSRKVVMKLMDEYKKLLGQKSYDNMINSINLLIEYHKSIEK